MLLNHCKFIKLPFKSLFEDSKSIKLILKMQFKHAKFMKRISKSLFKDSKIIKPILKTQFKHLKFIKLILEIQRVEPLYFRKIHKTVLFKNRNLGLPGRTGRGILVNSG